jgi:hypothetical protein
MDYKKNKINLYFYKKIINKVNKIIKEELKNNQQVVHSVCCTGRHSSGH